MMMWPALKTMQRMSPELRDPDCVYRAGDLLLPYWVVRRPASLKVAVVAVGSSWLEFKPREDGGGFIGRHNAPVKHDLVERVEVYCVSGHGRFVAPCSPSLFEKYQPQNMIGAVRPWYIQPILLEQQHGNEFWLGMFTEISSGLGSLAHSAQRALIDLGTDGQDLKVVTDLSATFE